MLCDGRLSCALNYTNPGAAVGFFEIHMFFNQLLLNIRAQSFIILRESFVVDDSNKQSFGQTFLDSAFNPRDLPR